MNSKTTQSNSAMYSERNDKDGLGSPPHSQPPTDGSYVSERDVTSVKLAELSLMLQEIIISDEERYHPRVGEHTMGCRCEQCEIRRQPTPVMPYITLTLHDQVCEFWAGTFSEVHNLHNQLKSDKIIFREEYVHGGSQHAPIFHCHLFSRDCEGVGSSTTKKQAKALAFISLLRLWSLRGYTKMDTMWGLNGHNGTVNGINNHRILTTLSESIIWIYAIIRFGPAVCWWFLKLFMHLILAGFGWTVFWSSHFIQIADMLVFLYVCDYIIPTILSRLLTLHEPSRVGMTQHFRQHRFAQATYHLIWVFISLFIKIPTSEGPSVVTCLRWLMSYYNAAIFGERFGGRANRLLGLEELIEGRGGRYTNFLLYFNVYCLELVLLIIDMVLLFQIRPLIVVWVTFKSAIIEMWTSYSIADGAPRFWNLAVWLSYYATRPDERPFYFWPVYAIFCTATRFLYTNDDSEEFLWSINLYGTTLACVGVTIFYFVLLFTVGAPLMVFITVGSLLFFWWAWFTFIVVPVTQFSNNPILCWFVHWCIGVPFDWVSYVMYTWVFSLFKTFYWLCTSNLTRQHEVPVYPNAHAIRQRHRRLMLRVHPDKPGGSHEAFLEARQAMDDEIEADAVSVFTMPPIFVSTDQANTGGEQEEKDGSIEYRAGGKGKRMVNEKVKKKGSGGKSKQRNPPRAPPPVDDSSSDEEEEVEEGEPEMIFIYSDFPNVRSTHTGSEMTTLMLGHWDSYDCMGAPYCGYTCIDIALGIKPDEKLYQSWVPDADPFDGGTFDRIDNYAKHRGVNLAIVLNRLVIHRQNHLNSFRWVILNFTAEMDNAGEQDFENGHYELIVAPSASAPVLDLPVPLYQNGPWWSFLCFQVVSVDYYVNSNNDDKRPVRDQRERIAHQDRYAKVRMVLKTPWDLINGWIVDYYNDVCTNQFDQDCAMWLFNRFCVREYNVSVVRVLQSYSEMQYLEPEQFNKAWLNMGRLREVNTRSDLVNLHYDGVEYLKHLGHWLAPGSSHFNTVGLRVYNAPNTDAFIANIDVIMQNQFRGAGMTAGGVKIRKEKLNHFKSFDLSSGCKHGVVVATAPIGCIRTASGPVCPGPIPLTDAYGVLAAFAGRSMIKNQDDLCFEEIENFIVFAKAFWQPFIDSTNVSGLYDEEPEVYFAAHFKGRKSAAWIKQHLEQYKLYKQNLHQSKFTRNSCFVKFENSAKIVKGVLRSRPRLIMTLKPSTAVEVCQVHKVIEAFNHTRYSEFIVKGLDSGGVSNMVEMLTDKAHVITDMTAFESSLNEKVRVVENYIIESLLRKAGLLTSLDAFDGIEVMRILATKFGVMKLTTRCSGDPWTSFSNGTSNVSLNAYCAYMKGHDMSLFNMIAEGDDGIVSPLVPDVGIMGKLGFKFSSELTGTQPGDVDFLRCRFVSGHKLLNIGRALTNLWVKTQVPLGINKQLAILRCMGYSLYYQSPGHPILTAIVNKIGLKTRNHTKAFKSFSLFSNGMEFPSSYPRDVQVDPHLRMLVAEGACGFPPISIAAQLAIEDCIYNNDDMYIGHLLDDYEDVRVYVESGVYTTPVEPRLSPEMRSLIIGLGCITGCEFL